MKKGLYRTGVALGLIFDIYLLIVIAMIQSRSENITAFAIISALVPLVAGVGCVIWFVAFIVKLISKEASIGNYKLPIALTSVAVVVVFMIMMLRGGVYA